LSHRTICSELRAAGGCTHSLAPPSRQYTVGVTLASAAQLDESVPPISSAQQRALAEAELTAKRFAFAPKLASFNGVTLLLAAALSLLLSLSAPSGLAPAALLAVCGWIELSYGKKLRDYEPAAPLALALNQLALLVAIVAYAVWKLSAAVSGRLSLASELQAHPELAAMLDNFGDPALNDALAVMSDLFRTGLIVGYSALILVAVIVQGAVAYYYSSRRKHLREFLERTPAWVVEMMRRSR
jgi:hypothetical protein